MPFNKVTTTWKNWLSHLMRYSRISAIPNPKITPMMIAVMAMNNVVPMYWLATCNDWIITSNLKLMALILSYSGT